MTKVPDEDDEAPTRLVPSLVDTDASAPKGLGDGAQSLAAVATVRDDDAKGPSFTREARRRLGASARIRLAIRM